jgi:integrase
MSNQYRLYLHPNGYFYHRVKVPADIRHLYGKQIEQNSLQTREFRDAVRRLPAVIVAVDQAFARFRHAHAEAIGSDVAMADIQSTPRMVIKRVVTRHWEQAEASKGERENSADTRPDNLVGVSMSAALAVDANEKLLPEPVDLPLMSVISTECYIVLAKEKNWRAKTENARHSQIKQFIEICGDKPINRYTQSDIRLLKAILYALPPQSHGKKEFRGLSKLQIAEKAKELGISGLSAESVRQVMTAVNIVFGWARAEHEITLQNIVQPMIPPPSSGGSKKGKREAFTADELQELFNSPVFTGAESMDAWFKAGEVRMHHTGRFWVPFLALYSGARLMEAVQLLREDIGCENGIWFIDINEDDERLTGKSVKNESSVRRVPVHPTLVEIGFLDFVATIPAGGRLFPDINIGPSTQRHRHASKMFNKLLLIAGIKGPKKVWHSLRHSFEQACRDSRVDSAIMDQLQGHSQKGMRGVYGDGYQLPTLYDGVKSIRFDGLDLSHIQPFERRQEPSGAARLV